MQQSKFSSLFESALNVLIGYVIAIGAQLVVFPLFNIHASVSESMAIAACFTAVSLLRSYLIRRFFNAQTVKNSLKIKDKK